MSRAATPCRALASTRTEPRHAGASRLASCSALALLAWAPQGVPASALGPASAPPLEEDCADPAGRALAAVGEDFELTLEQVDAHLADELAALEDALRERRREALEAAIEERLLAAEAARRGTTAPELLQELVPASFRKPSAEEVRAFFEANAGSLPGGLAAHEARIRDHLAVERRSAAARELARELRARTEVEDRSASHDLGSLDLDPELVVARIAGEPLTLARLDEAAHPLPGLLGEERHSLRRQVTDAAIAEHVLTLAASRRGVEVESLVAVEIEPRVPPVSDAEARAFYERERERLDVDIEDAEDRARVVAFLEDRARERLLEGYVGELRRAAGVEVLLVAPHAEDERLLAGDQPRLGPEDAAVTVVLFIDYECTSCALAHAALTELVEELEDVALVVRDFPLSLHPHAVPAAIAAEEARAQGRYWEYAERLFAEQPALAPADLVRHASALGLDPERIRQALGDPEHAAAVERDRRDGIALGVYSTPTVFVAGERVLDRSPEGLEAALRTALRDARERAAGSAVEPTSDP